MEKEPKEEKPITSEVLEKMIGFIITALGLVAALAWNEAIKTLFKTIFGERQTVWAMLSYAAVVTVIVVIVGVQLTRFLKVVKEKEKKLREKIKRIMSKQKMKKE